MLTKQEDSRALYMQTDPRLQLNHLLADEAAEDVTHQEVSFVVMNRCQVEFFRSFKLMLQESILGHVIRLKLTDC